MRALVIGGTRFIGPHVVRLLRDLGHDVVILHRGVACSDTTHVHAGRSRVAQATRGDFDVVIDMIAMNERDASSLVEAMQDRVRRLVMISSGDVYRQYGRLIRTEPGEPDPVPLRESSPLREKLFPYGGDYEKILVERAAAEMGAAILRLPAVYGPGDYRHRLLNLDAEHPQWRFTRGYAGNVAEAIVLAAIDDRADGKTYNVGEPDTPTEGEWSRMAWSAGPLRPLRADEISHSGDLDFRCDLVIDSSAIRRDLGYREVVAREEAIAATLAWEQKSNQVP